MAKRVFEIEKDQLKKYMDMHMTYTEIAEKYGCSMWTVMERAKEYGFKSDARRHQMIVDNPAAKEEIAKKISATVASMWEKGLYEGRINGMLGLTGEKNPRYRPEGIAENYRQKAMYYHPEAICMCCGKQLSWEDNSIEVHHVNENHQDFSLTNLKPLCHSCHRKYHRKSQFICTVTKSFSFDCCHYLPYHDRKCKFLHGHTYHMEVSVRDRVLQETGMVIDFNLLKQAVNECIIDKFDHGFLNEYIEYPTCEIMINWIWQQLSVKLKGLCRIRLWETDGSYCEMTSGTILYYLQNFECDWTKDKEESDESDINQ